MIKTTLGSIVSNNKFLLVLGLPLLIVALSIGYYLVIFLPKQQADKLELEKQAQIQSQKLKAEEEKLKTQEQIQKQVQVQQSNDLLNKCLKNATDVYTSNWNASCTTYSVSPDNRPGSPLKCTLPVYLADSYQNDYKNMRDECLKRYFQK